MIGIYIFLITFNVISVRIFSGKPVSEAQFWNVVATDGKDTLPSETLHLYARNDYIASGNRIFRELSIVPAGKEITVSIDGKKRRYSGWIEVTPSDSGLILINFVDEIHYLAAVVGSEMASDAPMEALKAQAVLARTFVDKFRGKRHTGFDFCDLTHCMHYGGNNALTLRSIEAVKQTHGLILVDSEGNPITPYFCSSNGGNCELPSKIWGNSDNSYFRDGHDPFSGTFRDPHRAWHTKLSARLLEQALGTVHIKSIKVDTSAFPMMVNINSDNHVVRIRMCDFKTIVNRKFGWNKIKSVRFSVRREGGSFIFEGKGLGHGVGLSQAGAVEMAAKGYPFERILQFYFPGAWLHRNGPPFSYRGKITEPLENDLKSAISDVERATSLKLSDQFFIVIFGSTQEFVKTTSQPWWKASVTVDDTIFIQPVNVLKAKNIYMETLRREVYHIVLNQNDVSIPLWLREGVATLLFGSPAPVEGQLPSPEAVNRMLRSSDMETFKGGWMYSAALARKYLAHNPLRKILSQKDTTGGI